MPIDLASHSRLVNDVHSRLNPTRVATVVRPRDVDELRHAILDAVHSRSSVCVAGGRHAMGGQQFGTDACLIDMTGMNRVIRFDPDRGLIETEAGADWPTVAAATHAFQPGEPKRWGIRQKQTGADRLTLGGALAANVHGRGLHMRPIVDDVESFRMINADGELIECSRSCNEALFSLAIGGYGLFGIIATVTLRLGPHVKLRRLVDVLDIDEAIAAVRRRAREGCLYGDFQYAIDPADDGFLRRGVCACYAPVPHDTRVSEESSDLHHDQWLRLLRLAHDDKHRAFHEYASHYLATHGRVYWSDVMQFSTYLPTYAEFVASDGGSGRADESLVIGEQFVPPDALPDFLVQARRILRETGVEDIYGTIRSIRRDGETFLPWARDDYACVIFNLRTRHAPGDVARTATAFRGLNDAALELAGSFYLTYHRFATRRQIERAYPRFADMLARKREYDPREIFQSDWYRHHARMFNGTA